MLALWEQQKMRAQRFSPLFELLGGLGSKLVLLLGLLLIATPKLLLVFEPPLPDRFRLLPDDERVLHRVGRLAGMKIGKNRK